MVCLEYVTDVLEDAKTYSNHAGNTNVTKEDVKFAVQMKLENSFTSPPPREVRFTDPLQIGQ